MPKITLTSLVTLLTSLHLVSAGLHKRHHNLAGRALHEHAQIARNPLEGSLDSIPLKPRTAGITKRAEYTLLGCYSELSTDGIDLLNNVVPWNRTNIQECVESCATAASSPYPYAGIIRGDTCKCGNTIPVSSTSIEQSNCRSQCASGDEQWCGGQSAYQVYYLPSATPVTTADVQTTIADTSSAPDTSTDANVSSGTGTEASPTSDTTTEASPNPGTITAPETAPPSSTNTNPTVPPTVIVSPEISYNYVGCYEDTTEIITRVLRGPGFASSSMTPTSCSSFCFSQGYPYAGTESEQCFCGATLFATTNSDQCVQSCPGDSTIACGTPLHISIYSITDASVLGSLQPLPASSSGEWSSVGCYIDDLNTHVMEVFVPAIPSNGLSVDACTEACKGLGHSYAGLEYGSQCFCSNNAPTLQADAHDCDMPCPVGGGSCGAGLRLDVYKSGI